MEDDPVLVAHGLRKSYGDREAVHGLSFTLKPGQILGFLGPNGAGKTTAVRILTTITYALAADGLSPDGGDVVQWTSPDPAHSMFHLYGGDDSSHGLQCRAESLTAQRNGVSDVASNHSQRCVSAENGTGVP